MQRTFLSILVLAVTMMQAHATEVSVQNAWARATSPKAQAAAVYLSITDAGRPDRLTGLSTPIAGKAAVHESYRKGNVVGMRPVEGGLALSTSGPTVLAPGGYHVMLTQLHKPLVEGTTFPLTLEFEKAGKVETVVRVEAAGAGGPMGEMHHDMGAGHDMESMPGMSH